MFDTMTLTKATGAVCGSLLVFLLGSWAAESIYSMGGGHGEGHGEDVAQGYIVDTGDEGASEEPVDEGPDLAALFAAADADKGARVFNKCKACHQTEKGANGVGPYLYGVVGRKVDTAEGYSYSGALEKVVDVWSAENLFNFLENPAGYAPGTAMGFAGLKKPEDRVNVIAYLDTTDGTDDIVIEASAPAVEPAAEEAAAPEAAAVEEAAAEEAPAAAPEAAAEEAPAVAPEAPTEEPKAEEAPAAADDSANASDAAPNGDESGFAAMVAAADIEAGKKAFRRCAACHAVEDGKNKVGPYLSGVVGRDIASADGFNYSDALKGLEGDWTADKLNAWLENPRDYAPGNRMGFPGLKKEADRAAVIAYLQSVAN